MLGMKNLTGFNIVYGQAETSYTAHFISPLGLKNLLTYLLSQLMANAYSISLVFGYIQTKVYLSCSYLQLTLKTHLQLNVLGVDMIPVSTLQFQPNTLRILLQLDFAMNP